jgi:pseudouridine synthase
MVRLQRVLADAGVAARRACEELILQGAVEVNGRVVSTLPAFVDPRADRITVMGRPLPRREQAAPRKIYVMLNKPPRVLTVARDEPGADRMTVSDLVQHPGAPRLFPVGRLDYEAVGLLLLTNDGDLTHRLTHPRFETPRTYAVTVKGWPQDVDLEKVGKLIVKAERREARKRGRALPAAPEFRVVTSAAGGRSGRGVRDLTPEQAGTGGVNTVVEVTVRERGQLDFRGAFAACGFPVRAVERVGFGPLRLRAVARGKWRELDRDELKALKRFARGEREQNAPGPARARPAPMKAAGAPVSGASDEEGGA